MSQIDLSQLPPPDIIESLDFETIYQEKLADFRARNPEFGALLESDPAVIMLELASYLDMTTRARINDAARACNLATAVGADLDNLAALLGVTRQVVDPGNVDATPPVLPTYETDNRLRLRAQMALEGTTVAGSRESYVFHAMSASPAVLDVSVDSPAPGDVRVTVLSINGVADDALLVAVAAYLSSESRRPLTDNVITESATLVDFEVSATLHFYPGPSADAVIAEAHAALGQYLSTAARLGYDITRSGLFAALHRPGVRQVLLDLPTDDITIGPRAAARCTGISITAGDRDV